MSVATPERAKASRQHALTVPPYRPDPAIIGNVEGNERILAKDRKVAENILRDADEQR